MNADRYESWGETLGIVFAAGLLGVMWAAAEGWVSRETSLRLLGFILPPSLGLGLWLVWRAVWRLCREVRDIERERRTMNREFHERERKLLGKHQ